MSSSSFFAPSFSSFLAKYAFISASNSSAVLDSCFSLTGLPLFPLFAGVVFLLLLLLFLLLAFPLTSFFGGAFLAEVFFLAAGDCLGGGPPPFFLEAATAAPPPLPRLPRFFDSFLAMMMILIRLWLDRSSVSPAVRLVLLLSSASNTVM